MKIYFFIIPLFIASLLFTYHMHRMYRHAVHARLVGYLWVGYGLSAAVGLVVLEHFWPSQGHAGIRAMSVLGILISLGLVGYGLRWLYRSSKQLTVHPLLDENPADQIEGRWTFDRMSIGVLQIEEDGKISECNIAASTMIGLPRQTLIGTYVWDLGLRFHTENGQPLAEQRIRWFLDNLRRFPNQEVVVGLMRDDTEKWFAVKLTEAADLMDADEPAKDRRKDRRRDRRRSSDYPILVTLTEVTTLVQENRKRWYLAHHDPATGLPNRRYLEESLAESLAQARQKRTMFALLFIDVDDFKDVNDQFGHDVGDELLVRFSHALQHTVGPEDMVARFGGDEFVILLKSIENRNDALAVAASVYNLCSSPLVVGDKIVTFSVSVGVSVFPDDGKDAATLLRHADQAMYRAKSPSSDSDPA